MTQSLSGEPTHGLGEVQALAHRQVEAELEVAVLAREADRFAGAELVEAAGLAVVVGHDALEPLGPEVHHHEQLPELVAAEHEAEEQLAQGHHFRGVRVADFDDALPEIEFAGVPRLVFVEEELEDGVVVLAPGQEALAVAPEADVDGVGQFAAAVEFPDQEGRLLVEELDDELGVGDGDEGQVVELLDAVEEGELGDFDVPLVLGHELEEGTVVFEETQQRLHLALVQQVVDELFVGQVEGRQETHLLVTGLDLEVDVGAEVGELVKRPSG